MLVHALGPVDQEELQAIMLGEGVGGGMSMGSQETPVPSQLMLKWCP